MMQNQREAQEKIKDKLRSNARKRKQEGNLEADMKARQENTNSIKQSSEDGAVATNKLQTPVAYDIPRTPTPDYADLNARFNKDYNTF